MLVVNLITEQTKLSFQVFLFATCMWFISSAINPVIYGAMNSTFRAEYKKLLYTFTANNSVGVSLGSSSTVGQEMSTGANM